MVWISCFGVLTQFSLGIEVGSALAEIPLAMNDIGTAWRDLYLTHGDFKIYALSGPDQIVTWSSADASPRTAVSMK